MVIDPSWLVAASFGIALVSLGIGLLTSYVKVSVVFGLLRNGLGTQQVPGTVVLMSLSLALTSFIMSPVVNETIATVEKIAPQGIGGSPLSWKTLREFAPVAGPWRSFLARNSGQRELAVLGAMTTKSEILRVEGALNETHSLHVLIPAFILTELKEAFAMGFILLLPFLVIDLVVANVLVGMGMTMVSPVMVSLPLKLLLFVAADGWLLISKGLIESYGATYV